MLGRRGSESRRKQAITKASLFSRSINRKVQGMSSGRKFLICRTCTGVVPRPCAWSSFSQQRGQVHHGGFWDLNSLGHSVSLVGIPGGEDPGVGAGMELDPNSQSLEDIIACKLRVGSRICKMVC